MKYPELEQIYDLKDEAVRTILAEIIVNLDELDGEDFFDTWGWRHYFEGLDTIRDDDMPF